MQSPDESQLWGRGPSLWNLIAERVPGSELSKIRTALGHFLVDMYTEVHTEAEMWYEMWQESRPGGRRGSRAGTPRTRQQGSTLADPPAVKELVRAEVKMLLQTLGERVRRGRRDGEELIFRYKPDTVNYALGHLDSCYSHCISPGETDNGSRPSSHCSVRSSAQDQIEAMRDKLNVTDIDQVVDRLRSVLMEECEVLSRLVQDLKRNIKQQHKSRSELDKSEPTLAELRQLRGAIQTDLELYPSSLAASPPSSPRVPVRELKSKFRLSAGQKASDETLHGLHATPVLRPHPPPLPRPPAGPLLPHTPASKTCHISSLSKAHGQYEIIKSIKTPVRSKLPTSGHLNSCPLLTPDQIMDKSQYHCRVSPEQDSAALHRRPLTSASLQIKPPRNSSCHIPDPSSHHSVHSPSREYELKSSSVRRSRNFTVTPSPIPALSSLSDAGSDSNSRTDYCGSTTRKSENQNGQKKSACEGGTVSSSVGDDYGSRGRTSETGSSISKQCDGKSITGTDINKNGHLGRDRTQQKSLSSFGVTDHSSHLLVSDAGRGQVKGSQSNGQYFTYPKRLVEGTRIQPTRVNEAQTETEFISKFYQPVPPSKVSS